MAGRSILQAQGLRAGDSGSGLAGEIVAPTAGEIPEPGPRTRDEHRTGHASEGDAYSPRRTAIDHLRPAEATVVLDGPHF